MSWWLRFNPSGRSRQQTPLGSLHVTKGIPVGAAVMGTTSAEHNNVGV